MDTLLNQLKEQDLELYQEIVADLLPSSDHRNNFIICGKLQESIRARGWYYSIWNTSPDSTEVIIRRGGEGYINPDFMHIGEGKNEAEALLIAYLAAI